MLQRNSSLWCLLFGQENSDVGAGFAKLGRHRSLSLIRIILVGQGGAWAGVEGGEWEEKLGQAVTPGRIHTRVQMTHEYETKASEQKSE